MVNADTFSIGVSLGLTFFAGLVSFASPCVLPLVPSYLGFLASDAGRNKGFVRTLGFVLGFVIVFAILGLIFTQGSQMMGSGSLWIQYLAGFIVIIMGLNLWFNFLPFLNYELKAHVTRRPGSFVEALVVGMAFGAGWTPCIGPILSTILFYAAVSGDTLTGLLYLIFYGLGLGVPFLVLSISLDFFSPVLNWMKRHTRKVQIGSGALLLVFGVLIITGQTLAFASWLPSAGYRLETWISEYPNQSQTLGLVVLSVVLGLPSIALLFYRWVKQRRVSLPSVVLLTLFITTFYIQYFRSFDILEVLARWLQFQGI